jgi:UDPglucose 6-dehydrogenase
MDNVRGVLPAVEYASSALEALREADACVLVTEWQEFVELDWAAAQKTMSHPIVVDGRNSLDGVRLAELGFLYEGIGVLRNG